MKKTFLSIISASLVMGIILIKAGVSYADDMDQYKLMFKTVRDDRARVENQIGIVPVVDNTLPDPKEFIGAKTQHYEEVLIMKDAIDVGIR